MTVGMTLGMTGAVTWAAGPFVPPGAGDKAKLLLDDASAAEARLLLVGQAKEEVNVAYFILHEDDSGLITLAELRDAARRGAKVRLLLDGSTHRVGKGMMTHLLKNGVEIKMYHPLITNPMHREEKPGDWVIKVPGTKIELKQSAVEPYNENSFEHPFSWEWRRMHDKQIIVDGNRGLLGSRNIKNGYFTDKRYQGFRSYDVDVYVEGQSPRRANQYFMELWRSSEVELPPDLSKVTQVMEDEAAGRLNHFKTVVDRWKVQGATKDRIANALDDLVDVDAAKFVHDPFDMKGIWAGMELDLLEMIRDAKEEIIIENPYILLTHDFRVEFEAAIYRGVRITVLTNSPETMDIAIVGNQYKRERHELVEMGMKVYEKTGHGMLHGKVLIVDRKKIAVTTYNMDPRSHDLNLEIGMIFDSPALVQTYMPRMEHFLAEAVPYLGERFEDPKPANFKERCMQLLRKIGRGLIRHQL